MALSNDYIGKRCYINMSEEDLKRETEEQEKVSTENCNEENNVENETIQEDSIEAQLANANAKIEELQDKYLRQVAEFDNYRKRTIKEKAELIKNASADILTDLLPFIDDLERAIANSANSNDFNALKEGIEIIYNKLMHTLQQDGLQKISPVGEVFDTDYHEAIALLPAQDEESKGKVIDCTRDGYKLHDKVLRHAQVAVAQ